MGGTLLRDSVHHHGNGGALEVAAEQACQKCFLRHIMLHSSVLLK